jgi:hypothetical protein
MDWVIIYKARKFLGGFDGEFRYKEWFSEKLEYHSDTDSGLTKKEAISLVKKHLRSDTADVEILSITKKTG